MVHQTEMFCLLNSSSSLVMQRN